MSIPVAIQGKFIKHNRFQDVAIKAETVTELPDGYQVIGLWVNMGSSKSESGWYICQDVNFIQKSDLQNWLYFTGDGTGLNLRKGPWIPFV